MLGKSEELALSAIHRRSIGCQFSHLWSDALFARDRARECTSKIEKYRIELTQHNNDRNPIIAKALARTRAQLSQNIWDRGTYVRWTVQTAYMAFERACCDALDNPVVSRNIPKEVPLKLADKGISSFSWSVMPWSDVDDIRRVRIKYTHGNCSKTDLLPEIQVAEHVITALRKGILEIYNLAGKTTPAWVETDSIPVKLEGSSAWASSVSKDAENDSLSIRIVGIYGEEEWLHSHIRSNEDPWPHVCELASNVIVPLSGIRIYRGTEIWKDFTFEFRGSTS